LFPNRLYGGVFLQTGDRLKKTGASYLGMGKVGEAVEDVMNVTNYLAARPLPFFPA
jgi:hypothetical protein